MRGPTLSSTPMKTYGPISVDLKDKQRKKKFLSLSLSLSTNSLDRNNGLLLFHFFFLIFVFIFFLFIYLLLLLFWIHGSYCFIRVRFCPETIYFFSVHFILNELSPSHFLTSEIFIKILSPKSLVTYHPENRKIFRLS